MKAVSHLADFSLAGGKKQLLKQMMGSQGGASQSFGQQGQSMGGMGNIGNMAAMGGGGF